MTSLTAIGISLVTSGGMLMAYVLGRRHERRAISRQAVEMRERRMAEEAREIMRMMCEDEEWQRVEIHTEDGAAVATWKGPALNNFHVGQT